MTVPIEATRKRRTLLIDADDTLWENNVYFLEVTELFLQEMEHHGVDQDAARAMLYETEQRSIALHGYGSSGFAHSVAEAFRSLAPDADTLAVDRVMERARAIHDRDEMEILPGVAEALDHLSADFRLILVTKGDPAEQHRKVDLSGLRRYFERVVVLREKDEEAYRRLIEDLSLDPASTWMIGNSPRSDINPALAAGLNAVLVPHPQTWELELEEVRDHGERLIIADRFGDIIGVFAPPEESAAG